LPTNIHKPTQTNPPILSLKPSSCGGEYTTSLCSKLHLASPTIQNSHNSRAKNHFSLLTCIHPPRLQPQSFSSSFGGHCASTLSTRMCERMRGSPRCSIRACGGSGVGKTTHGTRGFRTDVDTIMSSSLRQWFLRIAEATLKCIASQDRGCGDVLGSGLRTCPWQCLRTWGFFSSDSVQAREQYRKCPSSRSQTRSFSQQNEIKLPVLRVTGMPSHARGQDNTSTSC